MTDSTPGSTPHPGSGIGAFLHRPALNGWPLFWLIVLPMTGFMLMAMRDVDLGSAEGISHMIQYSVRWAVPLIYMVTAASAMPVLFPGGLSRWWLRNRRYLGLAFAVAMGWQGAFIFTMSTQHADYYYADVYLLRDEIEGSSGYLFLAAMVLTSFRFGRQRLSQAQWKAIHRSGVYFLWAYPFSVYWWNLHYYGNPLPIDYVFYWAGFLAFAARIAAWGKRRRARTGEAPFGAITGTLGGFIILLGVVAAATGLQWQEPVSSTLTAADWSASLELWLPFWPFEPFLPLVVIGIGTWVLTAGAPAAADNRRLA